MTRKLTRIAVALAALAALALALTGTVSARTHTHRFADRNHDGIPDRWERKHRLSLRVKQASKDQDRDQLNNMGEWKAGDDPRDADSDNDGIKDGNENAGTVTSFDGTTLVISLFNGDTLKGAVDDATRVGCHTPGSGPTGATGPSGDRPPPRHHGDDGDDEHEDGPPGPAGPGGPGGPRPEGDEGEHHGPTGASGPTGPSGPHGPGHRGHHGHHRGNACPAGSLKAGALVEGARLSARRSGAHFDEVELAA